ncbi:hypothetical protein C6P45_004553 [Maudiozyma exigua]|uniref:NEDD8-activating enzyme E1 catalytic subunit n=1 Tax=Maudiozyma exigua TaxID=34358 RepID=A0A9P6WAM3_MAUEX|nr:hypothetical protein C6P45_004553 [Kazachstania exigua]
MMDCKVLVLGAGGLGCEILKNLVMCHVSSIVVIDMDTIELTNLNRQFLFSDKDIGQPKATVAVDYIRRRIPQTSITLESVVRDLTTLGLEFYEQFDFIISGLDAIQPRRFINEMIIRIAETTSFEKLIPFIDGGTEGLKGHVKTVIPGITACWECSITTLPKDQEMLPMCTIINNPRNLKHVIEYVITSVYPLENIDWDGPDVDNIYSMILDACRTRAHQYNIDTSELNLAYITGIIKRIIPSVSSMNAIIAANTCNEFLKLYHDLIELNQESGEIKSNNFTIVNGADGIKRNMSAFVRLQGRSILRASQPLLFNSTRIISPIAYKIGRRYITNLETLDPSEKLITPSKIINKINELNLSISDRAASRLSQIYKDSQEVLKVGIESGGCHGFQYTLQLIPETQVDLSTGEMKGTTKTPEKDEFDDDANSKMTIFEVNENSGKVVIDPKSLKILNNTVLTYTKELIGSSFKISGGSLKSSCGCGSSFDVDVDV